MALPRGARGLSAVCDCGISDHTHLLFWTGPACYDALTRIWFSLHISASRAPNDVACDCTVSICASHKTYTLLYLLFPHLTLDVGSMTLLLGLTAC